MDVTGRDEEATGGVPLFLCGLLAERGVLDHVLGGSGALVPAVLRGYGLRACGTGAAVCADPGGSITGLLLTPDPESRRRVMHYAGVLGLTERAVQVETEAGPCTCSLLARDDLSDRDWQPDDTALALAAATAADIMAAYGQISADRMRHRLTPMQVRADSRLRAQAAQPPQQVRRTPGPVSVQRHSHPYAHFFAIEEFDLSFPRFDGSMSPVVNRAVFVSGDAVTVLPYDPTRDRLLLIEQFRAGPFGRGDRNPWSLEAIAGRIDPGETPEICARREAVEEAGLVLGAMHKVAEYYPSPGAKTEYLYSFVALTDLPDGSAGVFGVEDEAEDIRGHLLTFDAAMDLIASGEISNAPLLVSLLWLARERPRLRG